MQNYFYKNTRIVLKTYFRNLSEIWEKLDDNNIPAFWKIEESGKKIAIFTLKARKKFISPKVRYTVNFHALTKTQGGVRYDGKHGIHFRRPNVQSTLYFEASNKFL